MNPLGIIVAVTAEARSLTKGPIIYRGSIHLPEGPMLQISGMGPTRAALAARALLEKGATALLSWGSAGGLAPALPPGCLILPKVVIASDRSIYPVDARWHESLCQRLKGHIHFHTAPLVESPTVVSSTEEKATLFRQTGAVGVDMESAAVAAVAQAAGVPFMAVRAVADSAATAIPHSTVDAVNEFGRLNLLKFIRGLVRRPAELPALIRIGRDYRAAQKTLERVAYLAGSNLLVNHANLS